jgi:hypothetical protein
LKRHLPRHCFCAVMSVETTLQFLLCGLTCTYVFIERILAHWVLLFDNCDGAQKDWWDQRRGGLRSTGLCDHLYKKLKRPPKCLQKAPFWHFVWEIVTVSVTKVALLLYLRPVCLWTKEWLWIAEESMNYEEKISIIL